MNKLLSRVAFALLAAALLLTACGPSEKPTEKAAAPSAPAEQAAASAPVENTKKTYINGIDFGFPPYAFINDQGQPDGFDVESVNWIAQKLGFKVVHQPTDWDGIIPALTSGKIDFIAAGLSATAERAKLVDFTIPYYKVTQVLVVKEGNDLPLDEMLRSAKKIGVQRGTVTNALLESMQGKDGMNYDLVQYDSTDLSLEDLKIGRIDGSGMDSSIAYELMKNQPFKVCDTFDAPPDDYCYAIRKGDQELLSLLNKGLELLMADPYWLELKKKWDMPIN